MLRFSGGRAVTSLPSKSTLPWLGVSRPEMMFSMVVFPQPLEPSRA